MSGFLGKNTCVYLNKRGYDVTAFTRSFCKLPSNINLIKADSLDAIFSNEKLIENLDCVIHIAGKAYDSKKLTANEETEYFKNNTEDTIKFASRCASRSVKRFIFISTIKVNGESTNIDSSFTENDIPNPLGAYALSKYEAEKELQNISKKTNMEFVIVRPPLIYGQGVKGYFRTIMKLIKLKVPLPFGTFNNNKRSFIYIENFLHFLSVLIKHPKAANEIFLCSDNYDLSTACLLKELSIAMHNKNILFKIPRFLFLTLFIVGKGNLYEKLNQSLRVDNSKALILLGWNPPVSFKKAIKKVSNL